MNDETKRDGNTGGGLFIPPEGEKSLMLGRCPACDRPLLSYDDARRHNREAHGYEPPAIVYEGTLTTRAGSRPDGLAPDRGKGVEPDKLFGG